MAELDGATGVQKAVKITLPLIKGSIAVAVMLCIAGNMKIFDHIYVMTNGGPGTSSMVMALQVYKTTFIKNQFGYASAMSIGILVLSTDHGRIEKECGSRKKGWEKYWESHL